MGDYLNDCEIRKHVILHNNEKIKLYHIFIKYLLNIIKLIWVITFLLKLFRNKNK